MKCVKTSLWISVTDEHLQWILIIENTNLEPQLSKMLSPPKKFHSSTSNTILPKNVLNYECYFEFCQYKVTGGGRELPFRTSHTLTDRVWFWRPTWKEKPPAHPTVRARKTTGMGDKGEAVKVSFKMFSKCIFTNPQASFISSQR